MRWLPPWRVGSAPWSIRTAAWTTLAVLLALVALLAVGSPWTSHLLRATTVDATQRAQELARIDDLVVHTHAFRRLADLEVVTGEPGLTQARVQSRAKLFTAVRETTRAAATSPERQRLARAARELARFVAVREELAQQGAPLTEIVTAARPTLERALRTLGELRTDKRAQLARTNQAANRATTVSDAVSVVTVVLFLLGALVGARYLRRSVVAPLVAIEGCIDRHRRGEGAVRAPRAGARELDRLAETFNAMAAELESQRDRQLVFLAGVAHDLNNPLSALRLGVFTLRQGEPTAPSRRRTLELLDRQVDRLARIVRDLLDATRIEAGRLVLEPRRFDLREVVRDVVSLYLPTATLHDIVVDLPAREVPLEADPLRVEQVLGNLLSNAIKFSPEGGRVDVRAGEADRDVTLEVRDRGIGIAPEAMEDIFAPFHRTAPDVAPGTGLGLSVVRRIVQAHGGTIEVESMPGRGSLFRVRLPRAREGG